VHVARSAYLIVVLGIEGKTTHRHALLWLGEIKMCNDSWLKILLVMFALFTCRLNPAEYKSLDVWISVGIWRDQKTKVLRVLWKPQTDYIFMDATIYKWVGIGVMCRVVLTTHVGYGLTCEHTWWVKI
jgi:hypothetical protein